LFLRNEHAVVRQFLILDFLPGCPNEQASVETHWSSKAEKNLNFGELAKLCRLNPRKCANKICNFERAVHKVG